MGDSVVSVQQLAGKLLVNIEWRKLGACRGLDAGIFYPEDDDDAEAAKSVCAGCACASPASSTP